MRNFLRSFKTSIAGSVFGGGIIGQAAYAWLNGAPMDTTKLYGGLGLLVLGILSKDADKAGTVGTPAN